MKSALDAEKARRRGVLVLLTKAGQAWTEDGFRVSWRKACTRAGIDGLTFHDLRGTAVTRLALAGCSEAKIAVFTGLSLATCDRHYLNRDPAIADSRGQSWNRNSQLRSQTVDPVQPAIRGKLNEIKWLGD